MSWGAIIAALLQAGGAYADKEKQRKDARNNQGQTAPGLPDPSDPGSFTNDNTYWMRDPYTNQIKQGSYNFDPRQMGENLDTDMMWNAFMGRDNSSQMSDMDWRIKQAQQEMARLQAANEGKDGVGLVKGFGDLNPTLAKFVDEKGKPLSIEALRTNSSVIDAYNKHVEASSSKKKKSSWGKWLNPAAGLTNNKSTVDILKRRGANPDFDKWFDEMRANAGYDKAVSAYGDMLGKQEGNQATRRQSMQDLQNQIDYYTQAKTRAGSGAGLDDNPMMKFLNNQGPTWQGGDNTNPFAGQMDAITRRRMAEDGNSAETGDMRDFYRKLMTERDDPQEDSWSTMLKRAAGNYSPQMVEANTFDPMAANAMLASLNAGADTAMAQALKQRDAVDASRGMLGMSAASNELSDAGMGLQGFNRRVDNQFQAAQYGNDLKDREFNQRLGAAGQNNQANYNKARIGMDAAGQGSSMALNREGQRTNDILRAFGAYQAGEGQDFNQMMDSLGASNAMRGEKRAWDVQDYGFGRSENEAAYGRAGDMWNRLNQQRQQARENDFRQQGMNNQSIGMNLGPLMQMADWENQSNVGSAQMQNSLDMFNRQQQAAQSQANSQMFSSALGALGQGIGTWAGNRKTGSETPTYAMPNTPTYTAQPWTMTNPNAPPKMPSYYTPVR